MTKKDLVALAEALRLHNRAADRRTEFTPDHLRPFSGLLRVGGSQLQPGTVDRFHFRRVQSTQSKPKLGVLAKDKSPPGETSSDAAKRLDKLKAFSVGHQAVIGGGKPNFRYLSGDSAHHVLWPGTDSTKVAGDDVTSATQAGAGAFPSRRADG